VVFGSTAGFGIQAPPGPRILTFDLDTGSHFTLTDTPGAGYSIDASGTLVAFAGRGDPLGSNPDGNSEIFLFRMGDAAPSQLTQTAGTANVLPTLSADGQQLVFLSNASFPGVETPAGLSLFLMDLDSRTLQFVSEVSAAFEPIDQSPPLLDRNGGRIVFESDLDLTGQNPLGRSAVFVFDVETNQIRQVSSGAGTIRLDSVSADGMLAALTSDTNVSRINPDRNAEIFFFDLSGGNPAQVTRSRRAWNGSARVAEDGGSIVFISNADYVGENSAHRGQIFGGACRPGRE
jgi:Tol biopolymer transport system component